MRPREPNYILGNSNALSGRFLNRFNHTVNWLADKTISDIQMWSDNFVTQISISHTSVGFSYSLAILMSLFVEKVGLDEPS